MKWSEARKAFPNKFLVFEVEKETRDENSRHITEVSVIETCDTIKEALKRYTVLHMEDRSRNLGFDSSNKEELIHEIEWRISKWWL